MNTKQLNASQKPNEGDCHCKGRNSMVSTDGEVIFLTETFMEVLMEEMSFEFLGFLEDEQLLILKGWRKTFAAGTDDLKLMA